MTVGHMSSGQGDDSVLFVDELGVDEFGAADVAHSFGHLGDGEAGRIGRLLGNDSQSVGIRVSDD